MTFKLSSVNNSQAKEKKLSKGKVSRIRDLNLDFKI